MDSISSAPSSPTNALHASKESKYASSQLLADGVPAPLASLAESRAANLEILREQLKSAKIPLTKRGSIAELPQAAEDCQLLAGTSRCTLPLCEDSCTQAHSHHHSHAKPLDRNAPLVYSRPSLSMMPSTGLASSFGSPAGSAAASQNNSPQAQYRRASAFGFNFGSNRGSVVSTTAFHSGAATPADAFSGPPSPMSSDSSAPTSAPVSPRAVELESSMLVQDFTKPIAEEKEGLAISSAAASSPAMPGGRSADGGAFWRLGQNIVNLNDYRLQLVGKNTPASLSRMDLAPAPRDDCPNQADAFWDPRSPQPPSPVEELEAQIVGANISTDARRPELEFALKPSTY